MENPRSVNILLIVSKYIKSHVVPNQLMFGISLSEHSMWFSKGFQLKALILFIICTVQCFNGTILIDLSVELHCFTSHFIKIKPLFAILVTLCNNILPYFVIIILKLMILPPFHKLCGNVSNKA